MVDEFNRLARYLARRDLEDLRPDALPGPVDAVVLVGSALTSTCAVAFQAICAGLAERVLVTGGVGHSTELLRQALAANPSYGRIRTEGRSEAEIFSDILVESFGMTPEQIAIESCSTNCGSNATESRRVLDRLGGASSVLLIQDPTMQRRTHASFERAWRDEPDFQVLSFAPFVPLVSQNSEESYVASGAPDAWDFERFVSLLLGEIPGLRDDENGYGPRGRDFIDHVEIPDQILADFDSLRNRFVSSRALE